MQNLPSTLRCLGLALAGALALTSCNRAEYALLPRSASYAGSTLVAHQRPAPAATPVAEASPALAAEPLAAEPLATAAPLASAPAPAVAGSAPAVATAAAPAPPATPAALAAAPAAARSAAPRLGLPQRLALHQLTKKLDKLVAKAPQLRQRDATADTRHTSRISGNLRTGLVLLIIGLLVSLFSGVNAVFGVIGAILAIVGLVFIVLWLLDQA